MNDVKKKIFECIVEIIKIKFFKKFIKCRVIEMLFKSIDFVYLMFNINLEIRLFDI